jgi:hypothetical protein
MSEDEKGHETAAPARAIRVVYAEGQKTNLLVGDPEQRTIKDNVLPGLLFEGWEIVQTVGSGSGAYFILSHPSKTLQPPIARSRNVAQVKSGGGWGGEGD